MNRKQELNKKLAKWAGFTPVYGGLYYENSPNFTESLDVCFKWLVPKVIDELADIDISTSTEAYYKLFEMWLEQAENGILNAITLCLVIEKLINNKK